MCLKRSLNAAVFLLNFKPEWLLGKTQLCYFLKKNILLCMCLSLCYLYFFWLDFFQLHIFNCGSSFIMLTVSFIMLTLSTYKFQTCGWKRFHFLFMAVLRMVSKAALGQLTVAKWKWRMCSIDMFDLSGVWQPTGFFKEIITTRGESKIIWIFLFWVFFRNCDKEYQFYICTC